MRVGHNPLADTRVHIMPQIVAGVITHLPYVSGYHAQRLKVIQASLTSLREHAGMEIPVMIWDNGSGTELKAWLRDRYKPEYMILSQNVGKSSARAAMVRAFPPDTVVCIADDDIYFHPGWLGPQLELLEHFPNVGTVSGYPVRTQFRWGTASTMAWAKKNAKIERGHFIPEAWDRDFCSSIGRDYAFHVEYTKRDIETVIEYEGMKAYATAHHCQFVAYAGRIGNLVHWDEQAMGNEKVFDMAIDKAGLLRLTTTQRLTQHIGNVMEERFEVRESRYIGV